MSLSPLRNRRFIRHYIEMVIAMFAGMIVLGIPGEGLLRAAGTSTSDLIDDAPAVALLGMGIVMTIPMVWWMRRSGHGWRPCVEMSASMLIPTFAVMALLMATDDFGLLMTIEHVVMLPSMLLAMLLRAEEYTACHVHTEVPA